MKIKTIATLLVLGILMSPAIAQVNKYQIKGDGWFGCVTKELHDEIIGYAVAGDEEAFKSALASGLMTGECTMFKDGETVYLEDTSIWSGMIQVRRPGETTKYWTNLEAAEQSS